MIKAIIFDVDGVLLQTPGFFTEELERRGYKNAFQVMDEYYRTENALCVVGKGKATQLIDPYLQKIGWTEGTLKYFEAQYQFEKNYVNTDLISSIEKLKAQGIMCFLGTDQEENRAHNLLVRMGFQDIFEGYFISCYIGAKKKNLDFWKHVIHELSQKGVTPVQIPFFDDVDTNVEKSKKSGIQGFLFTDMKKFQDDTNKLGLTL